MTPHLSCAVMTNSHDNTRYTKLSSISISIISLILPNITTDNNNKYDIKTINCLISKQELEAQAKKKHMSMSNTIVIASPSPRPRPPGTPSPRTILPAQSIQGAKKIL